MGIGISLILVAAGLILALAVNASVSGVEIQTVGWILFVVGIVGLVFSLLFLSTFMPWRREPVVHDAHDTQGHVH
jgi:hypothetical protein